MIDAETILPLMSLTGEIVSETATVLPSLRTRWVSKWSSDCPENTRRRISCSSLSPPGGMMRLIGLPTASAEL